MRKNSTEIDTEQACDAVQCFFFLAIFGDVCQRRHPCLLQESDEGAYLWVLSSELARRAQLTGLFSGPDSLPVRFSSGPHPILQAQCCAPAPTFPPGKGCQAENETPFPCLPWEQCIQIPKKPAALANDIGSTQATALAEGLQNRCSLQNKRH